MAILLPLSAVSLALGAVAFRAALRRERSRGTLGIDLGATRGSGHPQESAGRLPGAAGEGGGVLLHLESGAYHGLNETGVLIWGLIDGERDLAALVADLRSRLEDAPDDLTDETARFLADLRERDLIAP